MKKLFHFSFIVFVFSFFVIGCGGGGDEAPVASDQGSRFESRLEPETLETPSNSSESSEETSTLFEDHIVGEHQLFRNFGCQEIELSSDRMVFDFFREIESVGLLDEVDHSAALDVLTKMEERADQNANNLENLRIEAASELQNVRSEVRELLDQKRAAEAEPVPNEDLLEETKAKYKEKLELINIMQEGYSRKRLVAANAAEVSQYIQDFSKHISIDILEYFNAEVFHKLSVNGFSLKIEYNYGVCAVRESFQIQQVDQSSDNEVVLYLKGVTGVDTCHLYGYGQDYSAYVKDREIKVRFQRASKSEAFEFIDGDLVRSKFICGKEQVRRFRL